MPVNLKDITNKYITDNINKVLRDIQGVAVESAKIGKTSILIYYDDFNMSKNIAYIPRLKTILLGAKFEVIEAERDDFRNEKYNTTAMKISWE